MNNVKLKIIYSWTLRIYEKSKMLITTNRYTVSRNEVVYSKVLETKPRGSSVSFKIKPTASIEKTVGTGVSSDNKDNNKKRVIEVYQKMMRNRTEGLVCKGIMLN